MASPEVCNIVTSILYAFSTGMDICKRTQHSSKHTRKHKKITPNEDELRCQKSLQQRPCEIRAEYDRSVSRLGRSFEIGDTRAQISLAQTLVILNTGLVKILEAGLSQDSVRRRTSQRSLFNLSEAAATDALNALDQLNKRITASQLCLAPGPPARNSKPRKASRDAQKSKQSSKDDLCAVTTKPSKPRPKPSPLLVRGGWVKSKSSNSVVTVASAAKSKTSPSQPRRRKSASASASASAPSSKCTSPTLSQSSSLPSYHTCLPEQEHLSQAQNENNYSPEFQNENRSATNRQPSMLLVPSDFFLMQEQQIQQEQTPPPRPPKIPLDSRPSGIRPRPPSVATFLTTSTKIGEIPEHRWPSRTRMEGGNKRPLPYTIPPPLDPTFTEVHANRRARGFKFWKRQEVAAAG